MNLELFVSAAESAEYGLTPARVRRWASRRQVIVRRHRNKRPQYRLGDLIELEQKSTSDKRRTTTP